MFQIQGDAFLAGVQQQEVGRIQAGLVRNQIAALIPTLGRFDLHDVGAQKGQDFGTRRPGLELGQIEDPDMIERAHGFLLISVLYPNGEAGTCRRSYGNDRSKPFRLFERLRGQPIEIGS